MSQSRYAKAIWHLHTPKSIAACLEAVPAEQRAEVSEGLTQAAASVPGRQRAMQDALVQLQKGKPDGAV